MYHNVQIVCKQEEKFQPMSRFGQSHMIHSMPVQNRGFEAGFMGRRRTNISGSFRGPAEMGIGAVVQRADCALEDNKGIGVVVQDVRGI
jgi:hypothetical protein